MMGGGAREREECMKLGRGEEEIEEVMEEGTSLKVKYLRKFKTDVKKNFRKLCVQMSLINKKRG